MSRGDILHLFIILVYIQPWCASSQRYRLDPTHLLSDSGGQHSSLQHLQDVNDRLSFLASRSNAARWQKLQNIGELINGQSGQYGVRNPMENDAFATNFNSNAWQSDDPKDMYIPQWYNPGYEVLIRKRQSRNCDTSRITIHTLIEYLRTGRICGRRVAHVRFGLGGRRR